MWYVVIALFVFLACRAWVVRHEIAEVWRKCKKERDERLAELKRKKEEQLTERCIKMANVLSRLTADDLKDPKKLRAALKIS